MTSRLEVSADKLGALQAKLADVTRNKEDLVVLVRELQETVDLSKQRQREAIQQIRDEHSAHIDVSISANSFIVDLKNIGFISN